MSNWNLNGPDLLEKQGLNWLDVEARNLVLEVYKILPLPNNVDGVKIIFRVTEGIHQNRCLSQNYVNSEIRRWTMRRLAIACGLYDPNGKKADGETFQEVIGGFAPNDLLNCTIMADCLKRDEFYNLANERELGKQKSNIGKAKEAFKEDFEGKSSKGITPQFNPELEESQPPF